jgi:phage tail P2-like protein
MNEAHGYNAESILAQLPPVLAEDGRMHALAVAITEALVVRLDEIELEKIYTRIDELPEDLLDILAVDFAVDWWDKSWPLERKRQSLKDSWRIHRILGTPEAMNLAVQAAFGAGRVEEWFDYSGKPHHFRVSGLTPDEALSGYSSFLRLLDIVKRESALLDAVMAQETGMMNLHFGVAVHADKTITETACESSGISGLSWLVDENGDTLLDEDNNVLLDAE